MKRNADVYFFNLPQVNDTSLEDVTHEDAVATLKKTQDRVVIVVARVGMIYADSGTPPPLYHEAVKSSKCYLLYTIVKLVLICFRNTYDVATGTACKI